MVLSHLKLAGDEACSSSSDGEATEADASEPDGNDNDENDCESMDVAPLLIDLPLDGSTKVILDAVVPAGTYTGVRAKLEAGQGGDDRPRPVFPPHPRIPTISAERG